MYPTLSDLLHGLFGINVPLPIQSFGFFMAISFLLAHYIMSIELKRKEREGLLQPTTRKILKGAPAKTADYIFSGFFGFILGYKLVYLSTHYLEFVNDPPAHLLSTDGSFLGGLALAGILIYFRYRESKKHELPEPKLLDEVVHPYQLMGNITVVAAISGLIGAKIFHNLENMDEFMLDPVGSIFSASGLTFYGGLICGAIGVVWYASKHGIKPLHMLDVGGPAMMLSYASGRIGCHVSGDGDWGIVNNAPKPGWMSALPDWLWSYRYPHNVNNVGIPIDGCTGNHCFILPEPVFPTPLYEVIMGTLLFLFLWSIRKKIKIPGLLFCIYLVVNGMERFLIESIRVNTKYIIFGIEITQAQLISSSLIITGLAWGAYLVMNNKKRLKTVIPAN
jgi:phosphatidylglycerol:prolipoprotein diacylglycerol transferase